jgi:hypothetical protein
MHFLAQTSTSSSDGTAAAIAALMGGGFLIFSLIVLVVMVAIYWVILGKTGYTPALSLLVLIPGIGGLIILIMLVFTEWPIQRELRACRAQLGGGGYAPPGDGGYPPTGGYPPPGAPPPGSTITTT